MIKCRDVERLSQLYIDGRLSPEQTFALAYRLGGDYDEAKDMAQEAFIRIYNEMHRYDPQRRFFPWMYRVAHNCCVNLLQKRPKDLSPLDDVGEFRPSLNAAENPEQRYAQREFGESLTRALRQLPEHYRTPIVLKYLEGFSYQLINPVYLCIYLENNCCPTCWLQSLNSIFKGA